MSEFLIPFLQGVGLLVVGVAGFLCLEFAMRTMTDRLTVDCAR